MSTERRKNKAKGILPELFCILPIREHYICVLIVPRLKAMFPCKNQAISVGLMVTVSVCCKIGTGLLNIVVIKFIHRRLCC
jgi:hypothetical protein